MQADAPRGGAVPSGRLLGSDRQVRIAHRGDIYTLRETRAGKLILTK